MSAIQIAILLLVAVVGTAVALTRDVLNQAIGISFFGLILALMFTVFQAPDVALSQIVIGAVGLPLMILLSLAKLRRDAKQREQKQQARPSEGP